MACDRNIEMEVITIFDVIVVFVNVHYSGPTACISLRGTSYFLLQNSTYSCGQERNIAFKIINNT